MIAKEAKKGQKVKLEIYNIVIGIALEDIEKGDLVIQDQEKAFPVISGGYLKILPGVKTAIREGCNHAYF